MNLDELRSVQSKERQKDSLQNLRPSFYQEVGEYISDLEAERDRAAERAEDPFSSPEVSRLTDEIETARDVVEAIYERRMGKLVKQASLAAAGMPADDEGLTAEEADLFDDLVDRIESNKSRVLDVLEGVESESAADSEPEPEPGAADRASESAGPTDPGTVPNSTADHSADGARRPGAGTDDSTGQSRDEDAPPVPPQEPAPDSEDTAADSTDGVSPADVMGGEPSSLGEGEATDASGAEPVPPQAGEQSSTDTEPSDPQPPSEPVDSGSGPAPTESAAPDGDAESESPSSSMADVDRTTVRITQDIGSILGIDDREYTLSSDDVVTLPEQNADPLVERDAAERLE